MKCPVSIRAPRADDQPAFLAAVRRSRKLHRSWVSPPVTPARFRKFLKRADADNNCIFLIAHRTTNDLVGVITISEIVRGQFRSAYLGYYAFAGFAGQGLMQEGMRRVIRHAFGKLRLHRLEANIQPGNRQSIALVKKLGFRREGYSPKYLKIAGRWRDHERWAILAGGI